MQLDLAIQKPSNPDMHIRDNDKINLEIITNYVIKMMHKKLIKKTFNSNILLKIMNFQIKEYKNGLETSFIDRISN